MVYKHAISTVVPSRAVRLPSANTGEGGSSGQGFDDDAGNYGDDNY